MTNYFSLTLNGPRAGSKTVTFNILPADISTAQVTIPDQVYSTELEPSPTLIWNNMQLEQGKDFEVSSYSDDLYVGDVTVTITGKGNFEGTVSGTLTINPANQTPSITATAKLSRGGNELDLTTLVSGAEGEVSFAVKSGTAAILSGTTLTSAADDTGEVVITVNIAEKDMNNDGTPEYNAYTGDGAITVTVVDKADAGVSIAGGDVTKTYGDPSFRLTANAANEGANGGWTWRSSNEKVATVDNNGNVTILSVGNSNITTAYESSTTIGEATIALKVNPKSFPSVGTLSYSITTQQPGEGGTVTTDRATARPGAKVTVTPKPEKGYETDTVKVTDRNGNEIPTTKNGDGTYSFTMPASKVMVTATFKEKAHDCPSAKFRDVEESDWYHEYVDYVVEKGLMQGVAAAQFAPNAATTRAMIVTILYRLEGKPAISGTSPFDDVEAGKWYTDAVIWANANGIVEGYGNGKFGPMDNITREQMAAILYRYEQYKGGGFTGAWYFPLEHNDAGQIS